MLIIRRAKQIGYYISEESSYSDEEVANCLKITMHEYQDIMKKKFNGFLDSYLHEVYFSSEDEAKKALEWVESRILMNKMRSLK